MNLIELINENHFLKRLYPKGFSNISISKLSSDFSDIYLSIRTEEKPAIHIDKYGEWGKDYDTIEFDLIGSIPSYLEVQNWNFLKNEPCDFEIKKTDKIFIEFYKIKEWSIKIEVEFLMFQSCRTYLKEDHDYYPL